MKGQRRTVGFLLVDAFSMMSFSAAIEALRQANRLSSVTLYEWFTCSVDGDPTVCSAGIRIDADHAIGVAPEPDLLIVVSATSKEVIGETKIRHRLRYYASRSVKLGALTYGAYILARAGLLDGRRCTVHWENLEAFRESFPELNVTADLFEIDRDRYTCSGGIASLDMMLHYILADHGEDFASRVADQFLHQRIREQEEYQRMPLRTRIGVSHPKLLQYVELLEQDCEMQLTQRELAETVGLSSRQLERLFQKYLHTTPSRYYMDHRLKRARALLRNTSLSIIEVAIACGFTSHSHFSKNYRERFGTTPRDERQRADVEALSI